MNSIIVIILYFEVHQYVYWYYMQQDTNVSGIARSEQRGQQSLIFCGHQHPYIAFQHYASLAYS